MATASTSSIPAPLASVRSFLSEKHGLLIGGRFAPAADGRDLDQRTIRLKSVTSRSRRNLTSSAVQE